MVTYINYFYYFFFSVAVPASHFDIYLYQHLRQLLYLMSCRHGRGDNNKKDSKTVKIKRFSRSKDFPIKGS